MILDFKKSLLVSILIHSGVFISFYVAKKTERIIPVDIYTYAPLPEKDIRSIKPAKELESGIAKKTKTKESPPEKFSMPRTELTPHIRTDFPYIYYLKIIHQKIADNFYYSKNVKAGINKPVVCYFEIQRDGSIKNLRIDTSSGDELFDSLAVRAIEASQPFPPLPGGYLEPTLNVYFEFNLTYFD